MTTEADLARATLRESTDVVPAEVRDAWAEYLDGRVIDAVWARPGLGLRERSIVTVATLATLGCAHELRTQVKAARRHGLSRVELCEVVLQVAGYGGLALGVEGMRILGEVFDAEPESARDSGGPAELPGPTTDDPDVWTRARIVMSTMRPADGEAMVARLKEPPDPSFPEPIAQGWNRWLTQTAFGTLWARPNLTFVDRERVTIAVLVALNLVPELRPHFDIALNVGISPEELGEQLLQAGPYVGYPRLVESILIVKEVLAARASS